MTSSVPERRRVQRVAVGTNSWLALPTSWSVELIDVGLAGLSFLSSHALVVGRTVFVTATLDGEAFNTPIQVCWCKLRKGDGRQPRYEIGATLQQMDESARRTLSRFLRITPSE
jgi:hypothetical protein